MENTTILKASKIALTLIFSYLISMGIAGLIGYQFQTERSTTSELLESLYLILNSLFFILTLLIIKLFMEEKQLEEFS